MPSAYVFWKPYHDLEMEKSIRARQQFRSGEGGSEDTLTADEIEGVGENLGRVVRRRTDRNQDNSLTWGSFLAASG